MAVITLTSDMGYRDHYVASVKGSLLKQFPEARIIDVSHHIKPFDIVEASFVLKHAYPDFPAGSIHIIGVSPERNESTEHLIVSADGHYFIGADNGIFSLLFDRKPDEIVELDIKQDRDELTFPTRDLFAKAAAHLARGGTPEVIGRRRQEVKEADLVRPVIEQNVIKGSVIYVDSYGNAITNISRTLFKEIGRGRDFEIQFKKSSFTITRIAQLYSDVHEGERLAIFSSSGLLEIAVNRGAPGNGGGASQLFGIKVNDLIRIEFDDYPNR